MHRFSIPQSGKMVLLFLCFSICFLFLGCPGKNSPSSPGGGKSTPTSTTSPSPASMMIDNLEDQNTQIIVQQGRNGYWYTYNDGTGGTLLPNPLAVTSGGANGTLYSMGINGSGFTGYGAGLGFNFLASAPLDYNAQSYGYTGVKFYALSTPAGQVVHFTIGTDETMTLANGGSCAVSCGDSYGASVTLTSAWAPYTFYTTQLSQQGWGAPVALDWAKIINMQFQVPGGQPFNFQVDEIQFVNSPAPPSYTPTSTITSTGSTSPTNSPTNTPTNTITNTPINTPTYTPTKTPTSTTINCSSPSQAGITSPYLNLIPGAGDLWANEVNIPVVGEGIESISVYLSGASGQVNAALYSGSEATGPISLITQGAAQSAVNGWNTIPVPAAYLNAGTYWLVCQVQNSTQVVTGFGDKTVFVSYSFGAFPGTYPSGGSVENEVSFSIYMNYCGGNTPTFTATPTITPTICYAPTLQTTYTFASSMDCWHSDPYGGTTVNINTIGISTAQLSTGSSGALAVSVTNSAAVTGALQLEVSYSTAQDFNGASIGAYVYCDASLGNTGAIVFDESATAVGGASATYLFEGQWTNVTGGKWVQLIPLTSGSGGTGSTGAVDTHHISQFGVDIPGIAAGATGNVYIDAVTITIPVTPTPTLTPTSTTINCSSPSQAGITSPYLNLIPGAGDLWANEVNIPVVGEGIESISVYLSGASGQVNAALYSGSEATGPISLITQGAAQSAVNGWNTIPVPAAYLNAGTYWLVCQVQNSTQVVTGFGDKTVFVSYSFGAFPGTYPSGGSVENEVSFSIYMNYCGGNTPTFTATPTITSTPTNTSTPTATATLNVHNPHGNWNNVGSAGFSAGQAEYTSLAFDTDGNPYVAFRDDANGTKATVMEYSNGSWANYGSAGFSAAWVQYTSLVFNISGTAPYLAYSDGNVGGNATVMYDSGSGWATLGTAGFAPGGVNYTSLAFDGYGTQYVAFQDQANGNKASVMAYIGGNWVNVGSPDFSSGEANYISLAMYNNKPYVAFEDYAYGNDYKATVMEYTSGGWQNVGSEGFSAGPANYTSLAIDAYGNPYVAFQDCGNDYKATVMEYTSGSWQNVGNAGFSAGTANYTSLAFYSGKPYVAFQDYANGNQATVMGFTGSGWANVGSAGFSAGSASYTSLAFSPNGTTYVAFSDGNSGGNATVMAFQ